MHKVDPEETPSLKGFEQLTSWIENRHAADVYICMEATGAYWEALAIHLHGLERRVSVVNPARIKAFAQSELLRTKTDAVRFRRRPKSVSYRLLCAITSISR